MLSHPRKMIRDTASYRPLMRSTGPGRKPRPLALRVLAEQHLGLTIQMGEHSPVDDARAALYLYHKHKRDWEHAVATGACVPTAGLAPFLARRRRAGRTKIAVQCRHRRALYPFPPHRLTFTTNYVHASAGFSGKTFKMILFTLIVHQSSRLDALTTSPPRSVFPLSFKTHARLRQGRRAGS